MSLLKTTKPWDNEELTKAQKEQQRITQIFLQSWWWAKDPIDHITWDEYTSSKSQWSNNYFWLDASLYSNFISTSQANTEEYMNRPEWQRNQKSIENQFYMPI